MRGELLGRTLLTLPVWREVFVSYHHDNDQYYYNELSRIFHDVYEALRDNSPDRTIDSDNPEHVMRWIRENYFTGTSCTIAVCGEKTPWRKYADLEIKATLDKQHGLMDENGDAGKKGWEWGRW